MTISIVICTYRRAGDVIRLLHCLAAQTYPDFETVVVDGSGDDPTVRDEIGKLPGEIRNRIGLRVIAASKGLTRQRNIGLREIRGDVVGFLDDDVTFDESFLGQVTAILRRPDAQDVGGLTGYDVLHYPRAIDSHWRLRRRLGVIPSLTPGDTDHLGRYVLHALGAPTTGELPVRWLPGYCMIYRRSAITGLWFDEALPTYGGEDKDFSMQVARRGRLLFCCDLRFSHHASTQARDRHASRAYQFGFGIGRSFAKRKERRSDYLIMARYTVAEFIDNMLSFARYPSRDLLMSAINIPRGILVGYTSLRAPDGPHPTPQIRHVP